MKKTFLIIAAVLWQLSAAQANDYHVNATTGSNTPSNGTQANPWKTITYALSQITGTGHTVYVAAGTYNPALGESFPIVVKNGVSLVGAGMGVSIVDAQGTNIVMKCENISDATTRIESFTIRGGGNVFYNGGIFIANGSPLLKNNLISGNNLEGGVYITGSSSVPRIVNNVIARNNEAGIKCDGFARPVIINNTISDNLSDGILLFSSRIDSIQNNIISLNSGYGINESSASNLVLTVWYNLFYANGSGLYFDQTTRKSYYTAQSLNAEVLECKNNIEGDPLFVDRINGNYHERLGSPAIDAGDPNSAFGREPMPNGGRINIGAYGNTTEATQSLDGGLPNLKDYYVDAVNGNNNTGDGTQAKPWRTLTFSLNQITNTNCTVHIAAGTYDPTLGETFPIIVKNGVSLVGAGSDLSILDAKSTNGVMRCVSIVDANTRIEGFTIRGGKNDFDGGGVFISAGSTMRITGNKITSNSTSIFGGGIYVDYASPVILNNTISENNSRNGVGIYVLDGSPVISNNIISENGDYIFDGAGIRVLFGAPMILNNTIRKNTGYGIYSEYANLLIKDNLIIENGNDRSGGIFILGSSPRIVDNLIANNDGPGIACGSSSRPMAISNNTISDNTSDGIIISGATPDSIINNIISLNIGYGIREDNNSPGKVWFNLFHANGAGLYLNGGTTVYSTVAALNAGVPEAKNNIEGDPLFVERFKDYHLRLGSPAINAGDPNSPLDPDGTRKDIGAFYFHTTNTPPAAPKNLQATAGDKQVTLTWAANTESNFLRYRIYGGTAPSPTTQIDSVNGVTNTTKTITGLTNGTTYYFRITAVNNALQESGFSNEVSAQPVANRPPVVANPISNRTLPVGGASFVLNLNATPVVFNDPDGDALTYTASSSDTNIATATILGSTLTVAPVTAGVATIIVTADDRRGGVASDTFKVTIVMRRKPDIAVNPASHNYGNVTLGSNSDKTFVVSNTGDTTLAVSAISIAGTHANQFSIVSGGGAFNLAPNDSHNVIVRFAPASTGGKNATLRFTSNDPDENPFDVALTGNGSVGNRPPMVINPLPDTTITLGKPAFTRNLNASPAVFSDPDGDILTYTVSSSAMSIATASLSGSTLTVTPIVGGVATIIVTANDGKGGTAADTFKVTVNRPPIVAITISNQTLTIGGASFTRNLNASPAVFSDPDGDALTFTASSSSTNIATASTSGSTLTVAPVAIGSAMITVTANDGKSGMVSTTFTVTVGTAPNRSPVVANTISNQTLTVGGASFTRNLNASPAVFTDPDGDALVYTATSSAPNNAVPSISGSILTVAPVSGGVATITITANDGKGGMISTNFTVTINRPPVVANLIPNQALTVGGPSFTRILNASPAVFNDPDLDPLGYTASSNASNIATATISASTLTVAPVAAGTATITVAANDNRGGSAQTTFTVTVNLDSESPKILTVDALSIVDLNTSIAVSANITDNVGVQKVKLFYREGGKAIFDSTDMSLNQGLYRATIPSSFAGTRGVEFKIQAADGAKNQTTTPRQSARVRLPDKHLSKAHVGGSAENAYRLISFPLASDNPDIASTLLDDLGPADTTKWRVWDINPQTAESDFPYREYPAVGPLLAGKSIFLITKENKTLTSGAGPTVITTEPFNIDLKPGWNMIASPFNFDIPIQNVKPDSLRDDLYTYNGAFVSSLNFLKPWEGYMIKVKAPVTLTIQPSETIVNPQSEITKLVVSGAEPPDWFIRVQATCERASDIDNIVGVVKDAAIEWDRYERFEPPPIGKYVMVSFPHRDWQRYPDVYTTDFRPPSSDGHAWDFAVSSNISGKPVTLRFDNLASVPPEYEIKLVDLSLKLAQDLRREAQYVFRSNSSESKKTFRLLIGKKDFIAERSASVTAAPATYELAPNFPNPFNPSTSIKFGLPEKSRVSLRIYNLLGKEVATLFDDIEKEAGYHTAIWEGKDRQGNAMPSGIYIYRLTVDGVVLTKKMTLIK